MKCAYILLLNQSFVKGEKEGINLLSTHVRRTTFQTKTNIKQSVTSFGFSMKKVLCTYIHMYIVSRCTIVYIRKYSPFGTHRERLLYICELDRAAATDWWHIGVTTFLATLSHEIWILLEFKASNFRNFPGIYLIL